MTISYLVTIVADLIFLALIIRAVMSWVSVAALQPVARFFDRITDPLIEPIRRRMPPAGGLDFSPLVVMLLVWLLENVLLFLLQGH
jgi:YggT family protein